MIAGEIGEPLDFATGPLSLGSLPGKEKVRALPLSAAIGAVSKQALIPYPPGVPLVLPGERVSAAMVSRLMALLNGGVRVRGVERQQDKPYIEAVDDE
jgi:arginine/lysine/ornithine decarboxylase